ncbi:unnamed protein product [Rotaria magnacalcarata]|uniref:Uncharacterized protein n=2 Tax=Rotaria magnacalcarata TaxID=392030 RepID=A0A816ZYN8_9BILA|nr:unnamed protein product [Rotaria magnacalcarata]
MSPFVTRLITTEIMLVPSLPIYRAITLAEASASVIYCNSTVNIPSGSIGIRESLGKTTRPHKETLLLKYVFENGLPKTNHTYRTSILNPIKPLSYYQTFLSSSELKDYFELIKNSNGPQINKNDRRLRSSSKAMVTRHQTGLID